MNKTSLYLLSGNGGEAAWWNESMPHFKQYSPIALELPGFGSNPEESCDSLDCMADAVLKQTNSDSIILACGVNSLPVLHAVVKSPKHFRRIILLGPIGAFLWERRLPQLMSFKWLQLWVKLILVYYPRILHSKLSKVSWSEATFQRFSAGYRQCRAFASYFDIVRASSALTLFETIESNIHIVWGEQDCVADISHAPAWEAILAKANLQFSRHKSWGHYPYFEQPQEFARLIEKDIDQKGDTTFNAHSKAGRLRLAQFTDINIPYFTVFKASQYVRGVKDILQRSSRQQWAVRSSNDWEDGLTFSNAGQSKTFLRVASDQVKPMMQLLFEESVDEVIVQEFIEPQISGVAFVRYLSVTIEWVRGHLEPLVKGTVIPNLEQYERVGKHWRSETINHQLPFDENECIAFLQNIVHRFHYAHLDIEWAWDGEQFQLLQLRPVTTHQWRRYLTSANISELLPQSPSRMMEWAQRQCRHSIPRIYAKWDPRVLVDNEPFTDVYEDASYINTDGFLSRLRDWGLPSEIFSARLGGQVPRQKFHLPRFVKSFPVFFKMLIHSRRGLASLREELLRFEHEIEALSDVSTDQQEQALLNWFMRLYLFVVQSNLQINAAIETAIFNVLGNKNSLYQQLLTNESVHRTEYETDPAAARSLGKLAAISRLPDRSRLQKFCHRSLLPGDKNSYIHLREWFRDNYLKLYYKFHMILAKDTPRYQQWLLPYPSRRHRIGGFWQSSNQTQPQINGFTIYPGEVQGEIGRDIIIVDTLDPGRYRQYRQAKAVISRSGGTLSHAAILLKEFKIPSAVIPDVSDAQKGKFVIFNSNALSLIDQPQLHMSANAF